MRFRTEVRPETTNRRAMETENTGPFLMAMRHVKVLSDHEIQDVLLWVDRVPLTREKANLVRDFSDAGQLLMLNRKVSFLCSIVNIWLQPITKFLASYVQSLMSGCSGGYSSAVLHGLHNLVYQLEIIVNVNHRNF